MPNNYYFIFYLITIVLCTFNRVNTNILNFKQWFVFSISYFLFPITEHRITRSLKGLEKGVFNSKQISHLVRRRHAQQRQPVSDHLLDGQHQIEPPF